MVTEPTPLHRPIRWGRHLSTARDDDHGVVVPTGTATLLAADLDGAEADGDEARLDELVARHGGARPYGAAGGEVIAAFSRASDAIACALAVELAFADAACRPRAAIHTGEIDIRADGSDLGATVDRCRRLRDLAHPGQVLVSRPAHDLVIDALPGGVGLLDLGEHRLGDLARAEHVWQILHRDLDGMFPALRSVGVPPTNLPVQVTTFVGREDEVSALADRIADTRLVTLTGAGGSGKTRLALQVASEVATRFRDGTWLIELATVTEPDDVLARIAAMLRVPDAPGLDEIDRVASFLARRRTLLVIDNCEHLIEAVAVTVDELLRRCPAVSIMATTREPLGLNGELVWRVQSLATPPSGPDLIDGLDQYSAITLFCDRASHVAPAFRLDETNAADVAEICRRLDGIPLAIELAAARISVLSPQQIVDGLHDQFRLLTGGSRIALPRQQTLEASVDWSFALLTETERLVLQRLAVMPGEFGIEAAEVVCSLDGVERHHVLDAMAQLADKSLLNVVQDAPVARYRLLETVRQYAAVRLRAAGESDAARDRLGTFVLDLIARWAPMLAGHGQDEAIAALDLERGAIIAALASMIDGGDGEVVSDALLQLVPYWELRGYIREARRLHESLLDGSVELDDQTRAAHLAAVACLAFPDLEARALATTCLALQPAAEWRALAHVIIGMVGPLEGLDPGTHLEDAVRDATEARSSWLIPLTRTMRAISRFNDLVAARQELEESVRLAIAAGNRSEAQRARLWLADALSRCGNLVDAKAIYESELDAVRADREGIAVVQAMTTFGFTLIDLGDLDRARRVFLDSLDQWRGLGYGEHKALEGLARIACAEDDPGQARAALQPTTMMGLPSAMRAGVAVELVFAALVAGDGDGAAALIDEMLADAGDLADSVLFRNEWLPLRAAAELLRGDYDRAERDAHEMLELAATHDLARLHVLGLETLAETHGAADGHLEATRFAAAATAGRAATSLVAYPFQARRLDAVVRSARAALGTENFERTWAEGHALTLAEATDYARRGRGQRRRPKSGWSSLTPAELKVADLVAEGLTNRDIGGRLFVSDKTVRTHLTHVFAKLGVTSRAQLASEVTRRQAVEP